VSLPRVLFVSRERHRLPLPEGQRRKWDALGEQLDLRVLAASAEGVQRGDPRFRLATRLPVLDGPLFYALLPLRMADELRRFEPDVVIAQNVHETALALAARAAARSRARVVLDLHGDWRVATRLYGSPLRRLLDPVGDALGSLAVRRADAIRTLSSMTTGLVRDEGVEPTAAFPAFVDVETFRATPPAPLPERPSALFVGVLERTKGFDVLSEAWPHVAAQVPDAGLRIVGRGTLAAAAAALAARLPGRVRWTESLVPADVSAALDDASVLVLPSRSEGLPRVVIEAFCRGRGVVGTRAGGIPDVVEDGVSGVLVGPGEAEQLASALVVVLGQRDLAERLGVAAAAASHRWALSPRAYADAVRRLVDDAMERAGPVRPVPHTSRPRS
jgi:glycosyltransferase involved in cell wall biosynthesis